MMFVFQFNSVTSGSQKLYSSTDNHGFSLYFYPLSEAEAAKLVDEVLPISESYPDG